MPLFFLLFSVANLAYGKATWVNDKRHGWADWQYGRAGLAVDGILDNILTHCAILDNYYSGQPIWMVDLGWREPVSGVIIVTWQGQGQGKIFSCYSLNPVFFSKKEYLEA
jgi:hypothetical protein